MRKYMKPKIFILFDSLTSEVNTTFQKNWVNNGEKEVVTLTATDGTITSLEKNNTLTCLKDVVYMGDRQTTNKRIETDGGICFSTAEFVNLSTTLSNNDLGEKCLGINSEKNNPYSYRGVDKIKKLNRMGLYHTKQLCSETYNLKSEK